MNFLGSLEEKSEVLHLVSISYHCYLRSH